MTNETVEYKGVEPTRAHAADAGFDLRAEAQRTLAPKSTQLIGTGTYFDIPKGLVGLVFQRSSLSERGLILANGVGVIDAGYQGEVKVALHNLNTIPIDVEAAERIAQIVFLPLADVALTKVDSFAQESERGVGGFGSSGRN